MQVVHGFDEVLDRMHSDTKQYRNHLKAAKDEMVEHAKARVVSRSSGRRGVEHSDIDGRNANPVVLVQF